MKKQYLIVEVSCNEATLFRVEKTPILVTDADGIVPFEGLHYDIYEILKGGMLHQIQFGEYCPRRK